MAPPDIDQPQTYVRFSIRSQPDVAANRCDRGSVLHVDPGESIISNVASCQMNSSGTSCGNIRIEINVVAGEQGDMPNASYNIAIDDDIRATGNSLHHDISCSVGRNGNAIRSTGPIVQTDRTICGSQHD